MTTPATRLGASVGELFDQAEETLYQLARETPSASRLLAAWPAFAARGAGLIAEVAGRGYADLDVAARAASTDPLIAAGPHLRATLAATKVSAARTVPDPDLTNVARLLGAATEIIQGAYERPGIAHHDAAASAAAVAGGLMTPEQGQGTLEHLQRAGTAWSRITDLWTRFTTGVRPSQEHVDASLAVQASIRALTRDESGAWVSPSVLASRVDIAAAIPVTRAALGDVIDIARPHEAALERLATFGGMYAPARSVELRPERVEARVRGRYVPVTLTELANPRAAYDVAASRTAAARLHVCSLSPDGAASLSARASSTADEVRTRHGAVTP